jgi:hypothetical protein
MESMCLSFVGGATSLEGRLLPAEQESSLPGEVAVSVGGGAVIDDMGR